MALTALCLSWALLIGGWTQARGQSPAASQQPELTVLKADFLPGEKTLFFDDFTDLTPGDAPSHFKVRGPAPELRAGGGVRQLTAVQTGSLFPNVSGLPKNFTYEAEIQFDKPRSERTALILYAKDKEALIWWFSANTQDAQLQVAVKNHTEELARKRISVDWSQPVRLGLWAQNGRVRAFVNGEKHVDANQVDLPEIVRVEILSYVPGGVNQSIGYRSIRFAESTPDFSQTIASAGRYVTYGILFDTGSDRLKPESAAVIQSIARGLETNPNLKLQIEGHTDSVGDAGQNLDLSRRRAEAVRGVLVSQFKTDAARLTAAGLGATRPAGSNDTPQGRAQNRRVEFVRQ